MSLNVGLHAFVSSPSSLAWRPAAMAAQGFTSLIVHALEHENETSEFLAAVKLRDEARAAGMGAYAWQTLHEGFPADACTDAAVAQAPHWDGLVLNIEQSMNTSEAAKLCGRLRVELPAGYQLGASTLPTFEMSPAAVHLEACGAVVLPQAYSLENGHTPSSVRSFLIDRPPVYVGWRYWTDFHHLMGRPLRRAVVESGGPVDYVLKDGPNRWRLHEPTRRVHNRVMGNVVGTMRGTWLLPKVAPTVRTTPMGDGRYLKPAELLDQLRAARFIGGTLPNRGGLYLAETTPEPDGWRLP